MFRSLVDAKTISEFLYELTVLVLIIVISAFILMFLWNRVLVPHVSGVKPLTSLLDALLMSITISVIRGY